MPSLTWGDWKLLAFGGLPVGGQPVQWFHSNSKPSPPTSPTTETIDPEDGLHLAVWLKFGMDLRVKIVYAEGSHGSFMESMPWVIADWIMLYVKQTWPSQLPFDQKLPPPERLV